MTIDRPRHIRDVRRLLRRAPVVTILGARQVGKTTLANDLRHEWTGPTVAFDLEDPADVAKLARIDVVHAGSHTFPLAPKIRAVALSRLLRDIAPIRE